ncbi:hypothetical protein FOA43_000816 [Brettanomyces nanus]|uniref:Mitochondrial thiamine pyrophosphate carrier 1 n=1 Tax=Eeniella nana TaxID=13502 RepID=A0A875RZN5_EENNA|nr:uncharacterized protein FOA43_000816 [Brettanomyces nanus]QPG73505.1 hypothetical protein FOA43_000816 [Brettanomyces nanus]
MPKSNIARESEVPAGISLVAGGFSGVVARFFVAPMDVIKIRLQLQTDTTKYRGITKTVSSICRHEGLTAFWKGNIPAEIMYLVYGSSQFAFYSLLNAYSTRLQESYHLNIPGPVQSLFVGSVAGCAATCASYPFDLLRTRLINNEKRKFASLYEEIRHIVTTGGLRGFFGGGALSVASVALTTGLAFSGYTFLRDQNSEESNGLSSGFIAGAVSKILVYPLDLLKRRRQISTSTSAWKMAKIILASEGPVGLYHGLVPSVLKSAPTTMLSLYCYEWATNRLMTTVNTMNA